MVIILIGLAFLLLTWWAILDVARKDFGEFHYKVIWGFIALVPFIGCIIYFLFGYRKGKTAADTAPSEG